MNKFWYLTKISFKRKVWTKWFVAVNVLLFLAIITISNIDTIIKHFGGDFENKQVVFVYDKTNITADIFKVVTDTSFLPGIDVEYDIVIKDSEETLREDLEEDEKAIGLIFEYDEANVLGIKIISHSKLSTLDNMALTNYLQVTKNQIAMMITNIDPEDLALLMVSPKIERELLDESKKTTDEMMESIMTTVFPAIILPFFMLSILLIQMIGAEVNDEKSTRSMEIIISNVSPEYHFFSKVLAGNLFVISQGLLLLIYGGIAMILRNMISKDNLLEVISPFIKDAFSNDIMSQLVYVIPLTLVLMILTFIAYALSAGILASMTTNIEDFQQVQTPVVLISVVGYYLAILAPLFQGSVLIKAVSYVPFISAILSPSLLLMGYVSIVDVIISILLMIGLLYLLIKYGLKVYKVGILNYSNTGIWKKMFKALKN
jgi:ABC-2 type transport system permease protein